MRAYSEMYSSASTASVYSFSSSATRFISRRKIFKVPRSAKHQTSIMAYMNRYSFQATPERRLFGLWHLKQCTKVFFGIGILTLVLLSSVNVHLKHWITLPGDATAANAPSPLTNIAKLGTRSTSQLSSIPFIQEDAESHGENLELQQFPEVSSPYCALPVTVFGEGKFVCGLRTLNTLKPCVIYTVTDDLGGSGGLQFAQTLYFRTVCTIFIFYEARGDSPWEEDVSPLGYGAVILQALGKRERETISLESLMKRYNHTCVDILNVELKGRFGHFVWKEILSKPSISIGQLLVKGNVSQDDQVGLQENMGSKGLDMFHRGVKGRQLELVFFKAPVPVVPVKERKIVIGTTNCEFGIKLVKNINRGSRKKMISLPSNQSTEMTLTMIKSVLMSKQLYNVSSPMEFHIVLLQASGVRSFRRDLLNRLGPFLRMANVRSEDIFLYSALQLIPPHLHQQMVYNLKCHFVRVFFPRALPQVDSIVYFDTDFLITGNISRYWDHFSNMSTTQAIGIAPNNEPNGRAYARLEIDHFAGIPYVQPRGVNSGLLLMNLTRLRSARVDQALLDIYFNYSSKFAYISHQQLEPKPPMSKKLFYVMSGLLRDLTKIKVKPKRERRFPLSDQSLLNIFLHDHPELMYRIPCQFNFMHLHCDRGLTCKQVLEDADGVMGIHGAGSSFMITTKGIPRTFQRTYLAYSKFDIAKQNVWVDLMVPILTSFRGPSKSSKCYGGVLSDILFKRFSSERVQIPFTPRRNRRL